MDERDGSREPYHYTSIPSGTDIYSSDPLHNRGADHMSAPSSFDADVPHGQWGKTHLQGKVTRVNGSQEGWFCVGADVWIPSGVFSALRSERHVPVALTRAARPQPIAQKPGPSHTIIMPGFEPTQHTGGYTDRRRRKK